MDSWTIYMLFWLTALLAVSLYILSLAYYRFKAKGYRPGKLLGAITILVIALVFANGEDNGVESSSVTIRD
jgi:hypothetical protein